jgi:hypothetical protein
LLRSWAQLVEAFISGQVNVVHVLSPIAVFATELARRRTGEKLRLRPCETSFHVTRCDSCLNTPSDLSILAPRTSQ